MGEMLIMQIKLKSVMFVVDILWIAKKNYQSIVELQL